MRNPRHSWGVVLYSHIRWFAVLCGGNLIWFWRRGYEGGVYWVGDYGGGYGV